MFCNIAKLVIIHKKFATYGYRQVAYLETCLKSFNILVSYYILL
jgi:hypothetical protein